MACSHSKNARWLFSLVAFLAACGPTQPVHDLEITGLALVGVPVDGYPNYHERLMLMAINRARSDPNSQALDISGTCGGDGSTPFAVSAPLIHNHDGSRAARFHCANSLVNHGGLSHNSYCTLRSDIAASNCDGYAACACEPGSEHFTCTLSAGTGTDPWARTALFGFSANGEVGSANNQDGWAAVEAWVTECPSYEGHRRILLDADHHHGVIGLGYAGTSGGCYSRIYFGDTGGGSPPIPRIPAACHRPETSSSPTFYANYYDPAGPPTSLHVVVDGTCHELSLEAGTQTHGTWQTQVALGGGCHEYWFLARDAGNARHVYPEAGSWGAGDCTDYDPTAMEADCETCTQGETKDCGSNVGECEFGTQTCNVGAWGSCSGGINPASEVCNGLDDNCDGTTDEGCACTPGGQQACGSDEGACQSGTQTCAGGTWSVCDGINPEPEICDNELDDDCDGLTDEDCSVGDGGVGQDGGSTGGDGELIVEGGCGCGTGHRRSAATHFLLLVWIGLALWPHRRA